MDSTDDAVMEAIRECAGKIAALRGIDNPGPLEEYLREAVDNHEKEIERE